jgi:predicted nucleic acid-binding protein
MTAVVSNTGPVLHLVEIGALELMGGMGKMHIAPIVEAELAAHLSQWPSIKPAWLNVVPLHPTHQQQAKEWVRSGVVHAGEAGAIALAEQLAAEGCLTRRDAEQLLDRLAKSSLWISGRILREAKEAVRLILE